MTAPFNPTALARKAAEEYVERHDGHPDRVTEILLAFARELIEQSGAVEALESMGGSPCEVLHHNKRDYHKGHEPCPVEARLRSALAALRSVTHAPKSDEGTATRQQ